MKINQLTPGQVVYSVERTRMGNTTMRTISVYSVYIKEIDPEGQWVLASWNANPPRKFYSRSVSKWRKSKPVLITSPMGRSRLATREEIKQMGAKNE